MTTDLGNQWSSTKPKFFDHSIIKDPQSMMDFITNILESSTEYSIVATDLTGKILLWNEGARRIYGYEPKEVIGKVNMNILFIKSLFNKVSDIGRTGIRRIEEC